VEAKAAFGVVVRSFGLFLFLPAAFYLVDGTCLSLSPDAFKGQYSGAVWPAYSYLGAGALTLIASLYLLRGASLVVRFAYPPNST
jgi:hypothetical protein